MNSVKSRLLRGVAVPVFIAASVITAVAPPSVAAGYNWSGFYAGVNAGFSKSSGNSTTSASCVGAPGFMLGSYFACDNIPGINGVGAGSVPGSGFTGGAQVGYNWQFDSTVVGIETDFGAFHARASRTATGPYVTVPNQFTESSSIDTNWLFTARGRVGRVLAPDLLGYITGGLAVTRLTAASAFFDDTATGFGGGGNGAWSASATKVGWTLGAGAEYALNQNWALRAEFLHVQFDAVPASGVVSDTAGAYGSAINTSTDLSANIARVGIDYKF